MRQNKLLLKARLLPRVGFPTERIQTPTNADLYCGGFVSKDLMPNANFVAGGLESPNTTKFATNDLSSWPARATRRASNTRSCVSCRIPTGTSCSPVNIPC